MFLDYYTIIIPFLFAIISILVNVLLSMRKRDKAHKINNYYIALSMMLAAASASTAFALNTGMEYLYLNDRIDVRKVEVHEAIEREKLGQGTIVDKAFIMQQETDGLRARDKFIRGLDCVILAVAAIVVVLILAILNQHIVFDQTDRVLQPKLASWIIFNLVGCVSFLGVLIYTKPVK